MSKNIYEKLQELRFIVANTEMKKSGKNKFAGYEYFELQDMMPTVISGMKDLKLCSRIAFDEELAVLTIINTEAPEEFMSFTMPMSSASLKGCHAVQNLGATMTYSRRYLWTTALDLTEADPLDATNGKKGALEETKPKTKAEEKAEAEALKAKKDAEDSYMALRKLLKTAGATNKYLGMTKEEVSSALKSGDVSKLNNLQNAIDEGIGKIIEMQMEAEANKESEGE